MNTSKIEITRNINELIFPDVKIVKINNNKYLVISKYDGCHNCGEIADHTICYLDKKGMDDFLKGYDIDDIENSKFDEYGGNEWYYERISYGKVR